MLLAGLMCVSLCACGASVCEQCNGEESVTCEYCGGDKFVTCTNCGGDLFASCKKCEGDGEIFDECPNCKGKGNITNPITWEKFECEVCNGEGALFIRCDKCIGTGNSDEKCTVCDSGKVECTKCLGLGVLPCSLCKTEEYEKIIESENDLLQRYENALEKAKIYEYKEALDIFTELGDYKDSKAKVAEMTEAIEQTKYNLEFDLEGDWKSVSSEETYFFSEEYGNEDENLRIEKDSDSSYDILYLFDSGSTSYANNSIDIKGNEFVFRTIESQLKDDTIKVHFLDNGNLLFEKYKDGESEPWSVFEATKIN